MVLDLKKKIAGGFAVVLLIFAVSGLGSILNMRQQQQVVHEVVQKDMPMSAVLNQSSDLLQLYRKAEKDVLLNIGNPAKQQDYYTKLRTLSSETRKALADLNTAASADGDLPEAARKLPDTALESFAAYDSTVMAMAAQLVNDRSGKGMDFLEANAILTKEKDKIHRAETSLDELKTATQVMLTTNMEDLSNLSAETERLLFISALVGLVAGVGIAAFVVLSITRPLGRIVDLAVAVARGDLNASISGVFTAEMGRLKESIEAMLAALKTKIAEADEKSVQAAEQARLAGVATEEANQAKAAAERAKAEGMIAAATQLEKVVEVISSASEELSAQVEQSSRGSEVQASRVAETATAMEEMNSTVLEVARNASQAAESTDSARKMAGEGSAVVGQVVAGIGTMQSVSMSLKQDMGQLGKQAEGIGQVMNVISDIADQTNLLALNAAIEAARAGDAGRGFAVVADEVRKLAEKTMTATREVGEAIRGIQEGARKNMDNVDRAVSTVEEATHLANKSGEALQQIVTLVDTATDQVRSIATASEQQSATSEEINRISSETSDAMRQSAQAVGELASQTQTLRRLIDDMKNG